MARGIPDHAAASGLDVMHVEAMDDDVLHKLDGVEQGADIAGVGPGDGYDRRIEQSLEDDGIRFRPSVALDEGP
ncbi:hypothetical protein MRB53_028978 [Persea americana]|uniref:Uncharacterized protein n=1 Tax=Persea americana TaxID=3435 RepID=A0ACC2KH17_PERAE|nr:hypothetical protein MRB53_028978 [Persea americana]